MTMISYAQNGEDVLLSRLFPTDYRGFYIDVGACHPTIDSVTRHFYELGWRGVNIEPVQSSYEALCAERPRDLNLNVGLADRDETLTLRDPNTSHGMATFSDGFAKGLREHGYEYIERQVPVLTLAQICKQHAPAVIDFLKIDVEGFEPEVIRGGDWNRWRPRVVVVEATDRPERWEPMLVAAEYIRAAFDGLNRYYLRVEDCDLLPKLATPVCSLDDYLPYRFQEVRHELEHRLRGTAEGLELARARLWETEQALLQARNHQRLLEADLERSRADHAASVARFAPWADLGPSTLNVARRLRNAGRRVPFATTLARRWLQRVG